MNFLKCLEVNETSHLHYFKMGLILCNINYRHWGGGTATLDIMAAASF